MNNWSEIRHHLIENFEPVFAGSSLFQRFTFQQGLDIFNQICTISGINDALYNYYVLDSKSLNTRTVLTSKLEAFLKKIFFCVDGTELIGALAVCMKRIFRDTGSISRDIVDKFFETDASKNSIYDPEYFTSLIPFGYSLKYSYNLRNKATHEINTPTKNASNDIHELLTIYLYVTFINYEKIRAELIKQSEPNYDFTDYLNSVKIQFANRIGRFVHINGKEDIGLMSSFAVERINYDEINQERKGTVDELRKNKVHEKRMMIWGDAGTGKSTSLEYLAYIDANDNLTNISNKIPVFISLALLTDSTISIIDSIFKKLGVNNEYGNKLLERGSINIFLDGINEVPKDEGYKLKSIRNNEIQQIISRYPNCFTILSNRPQDIQIFSEVPVFRLLKMSDEQISDFLLKNVSDLPIRAKIHKAILDDDRIKEIIRVPLMLSRFIDVIVNNGTVPTSRGDIIHYFINSLYSRERTEKKDAAFNSVVINRMLSRLGYESLENKETNSGLNENEIMDVFIQVKQEIGSDIDATYVLRIVTELGILEKRDELYIFAHQEYQDYFNAEQELINSKK